MIDRDEYKRALAAINQDYLPMAQERRKANGMDEMGPHGLPHWLRVWRNCVLLAYRDHRPVDIAVCAAFSFLHDMERVNDDADPEHGHRAASNLDVLLPDQAVVLRHAIVVHSGGLTSASPTVGTCWDADRIDLPRVGIDPAPRFMSTRGGVLMARDRSHIHRTLTEIREAGFTDPLSPLMEQGYVVAPEIEPEPITRDIGAHRGRTHKA